MVRRHGVLADRVEVLLLEVLLPRDPVAATPSSSERAEHVLELRRVVGLAALAARAPSSTTCSGERVVGEVAHEARAVEVRVHLGLEVDLHALGDEAERVVEARAVLHHRAEHHLVVGALRAALAAGHPGLDEDGEALLVPARRRRARRGQVEVEDALGLRGHGARPCRGRAPRKKRSVPAAWSTAVTWTSSWFISQFMRSFATTRLEGERERRHVHLHERRAARRSPRRCRSRRSRRAGP